MMPNQNHPNDRRAALRKIAEKTLSAVEEGSYTVNGVAHSIRSHIDESKRKTRYYSPESTLSTWTTLLPTSETSSEDQLMASPPCTISILEISTLDGARYLAHKSPSSPGNKIGILNFASAKKPGGGFLTGAQAQEESIARSSTLYPSLMTSTAQKFYTLHNRDGKGGYYTHAMIYSPGVILFRDDDGGWTEPVTVDVLTSPAVNAGVVRKSFFGKVGSERATEERIEKAMRERMGRILYLLEKEGVKRIVLGSFGTGVFENKVEVVARLWAELLNSHRFEKSFEEVVFAILGRKTFDEFKTEFRVRCTT